MDPGEELHGWIFPAAKREPLKKPVAKGASLMPDASKHRLSVLPQTLSYVLLPTHGSRGILYSVTEILSTVFDLTFIMSFSRNFLKI